MSLTDARRDRSYFIFTQRSTVLLPEVEKVDYDQVQPRLMEIYGNFADARCFVMSFPGHVEFDEVEFRWGADHLTQAQREDLFSRYRKENG